MIPFIVAIATLLFPFANIYASQNETLDHFHVCTVASNTQNFRFQQLIESCQKHQIDLVVLGMDKPYLGYGVKFLYVIDYINNLDDNDIVMFVDAFDVLILADKEVILNKFLKMQAPFVISAETWCAPYPHLARRYPLSPTRFKYLNTGGYIGYVGELKKWFKNMQPIKPNDNDQGKATHDFLKNKNFYRLDYYSELFLSLYGVEEDKVQIHKAKGSVYNIMTNTEPCVLHANGRSFTIFDKVYNQLINE